MKKMMKIASLAMALTIAASGAALATPSTQIWIPSTDIQPYKTPAPRYRQLHPDLQAMTASTPTPIDASD